MLDLSTTSHPHILHPHDVYRGLLCQGHCLKMADCNSQDYEDAAIREPLLRRQLQHSANHFTEDSPDVSEWIRDQVPSTQETLAYFMSLFPFLSWISHYNLQWAAGDLVAGLTIGIVVVPQGMAYAMLANLEPQFGLYSSFVGVMIYWVFGTSKDISIGPVAVLSTVVGNAVDGVRASGNDLPANVIASVLSLIAGCIVVALGLLRFGFVVDIISITSLSAFMTGSAITIAVGQLPSLLGLTGFSNRGSPYTVLINTISHLPEAGLDAVVGLFALALLYLIKYGLGTAGERLPRLRHLVFFLSTMRTVLVIVVFTFTSWLVNMKRDKNSPFSILGPVPSGLPNMTVPKFDSSIAFELGGYLPAAVLVMLVEHIAISKSFGRVNNYNIDPSQEMVAIGVTNLLGSFFGAYPSTGSFSRTAIQSKAGVRTPASGVISGLVVLLATYLLTDVFYYIPTAALAAVIIHAVSDLVTPPSTIRQFWMVSPVEVLIFFIGVFVSVFSHIENGLYTTVLLSGSIFAYRILKAQGRFLGRVKIRSVLDNSLSGQPDQKVVGSYGSCAGSSTLTSRSVFLPLDRGDGSNPEVGLDSPYPGVFIYRFSEGFNYPNANSTLDFLVQYIYEHTKRCQPEIYEREGDRPWNNPGPRRGAKSPENPELRHLPTLKAIILDFSAVNNVDITSVQRLIDVRNQLDAYTAPDVVDWHIACINNKWTKRALSAGGFGTPRQLQDPNHQKWRPIFSIAEIEKARRSSRDMNDCRSAEDGCLYDEDMGKEQEEHETVSATPQTEVFEERCSNSSGGLRKNAIVHSLDKPLFYVDLISAVQSAIINIEARI